MASSSTPVSAITDPSFETNNPSTSNAGGAAMSTPSTSSETPEVPSTIERTDTTDQVSGHLTPVVSVAAPVEDRNAAIKAEKDLCLLHERKSEYYMFSKQKRPSPTWDHCLQFDAAAMYAFFESLNDDSRYLTPTTGLGQVKLYLYSLKKPKKDGPDFDYSYNLSQSLVLCKHCFYDDGTPLKQCLHKLHKGAVSNFQKHIHKCHSNVKRLSLRKSCDETASRKKLKTLDSYVKVSRQEDKDKAIKKYQESLQTFINDSAVSKYNLEKPRFKAMMQNAYNLVHDHGGSPEDLMMGVHRFTTLQDKSFTDQRTVIRTAIHSVQLWFQHHTPSAQKFISLCQDLWDGKRRELLGISLMFIHPATMAFFKVSAGLVHSSGKKSDQICADTEAILSLYNISKRDLYRPVNDTTNAALKAGRLIVGCKDSGTCGMHKCELILKHATGQLVRKKNKEAVDPFPILENLRKKARKFASYLMDRKSKSRYKVFHEFVVNKRGSKKGALHLELANDTRVSGTIFMYQSMERAFFDLYYFLMDESCPKELVDLQLSPEEWQQLAEAEAVLRSTQILSLDLQTNIPGAVAISPLLVCFAKSKIPKTKDDFVEGIVVIDNNSPPWCAADTLHKNLPKTRRAISSCRDGTAQLVARLVKNYDEYFTHQADDDWMAMFCHPFMAEHGISILVEKAKVASKEKREGQKDKFIDAVAAMIKLPDDGTIQDTSVGANGSSMSPTNGHTQVTDSQQEEDSK